MKTQCTKVQLTREEFITEWVNLFKFQPLDPLIPDNLLVIRKSIQETMYKFIRDNFMKFFNTYRDVYDLVNLLKGHNYLPKGIIKKRQKKRIPC